MSPWLVSLLTSGTVTAAIGALILYLNTSRSLHANQPVVEATADEKQAIANASNFTAQQGIIATLERRLEQEAARNDELDTRMHRLERRLAQADAREELLEERNRLLEEALQRSTMWMTRYYDSLRHHTDIEPPPKFSPEETRP